MNNIPCIKCNAELFSYIKPFLDKWGYNRSYVDNRWESFPLLIINLDGNVGRCVNMCLGYKDDHDRELVDDVEEFLYRAALLKGFNYKKDNMFTKKDLKTGMVVKTRNNTMFLVVDDKLISTAGFGLLAEYTDDLTINDQSDSNFQSGFDIMEVYDDVNSWGFGFSRVLSLVEKKDYGKLIWKRTEIKEVTMQEIADKLEIPVENLRIKE